ncbi:hypothetical protein D3C84_1121790 [compost metagenome]
MDRLFDILISTVPVKLRKGFDVAALKKIAYESVLEEERHALGSVQGLIDKLGDAVKRL